MRNHIISAIAEHTAHLRKIREHIADGREYKHSSHKECVFGQWLNHDATQSIIHQHSELWEEIGVVHTDFHHIAKNLAETTDTQHALILETKLWQKSTILTNRLLELDKRLET